MTSEQRWKRIAVILGIVAIISTVSAGYWYNQANDRLCPWCQSWHDEPKTTAAAH